MKERDNCPGGLGGTGETAVELLGTGTRLVAVEDGTIGEGKGREKRRSCLRRPHGIRRRLTGRPVFSYGRHMVCTRWPKGLLGLASTRRETWINLFLSSSSRIPHYLRPPRFDRICLSKSR